MKKVTIGLFGFGVVGEGIYQVLSQKQQLNASIRKIVIKHPDKSRNAPPHLFSANADDILKDPEIDLVVELIDDAEAAFQIVMTALSSGKSVISANKKMIAVHHRDLIKTAQKNNVSFLYEAAVCGSIPLIRNLEEYFDNDLLTHVRGIINGSTNYILSKMSQDGSDYDTALKEAQEKGFAESDPSLDVEGIDAAHKLQLIVLHAFGKSISPGAILKKGITSLCPFDFQYARQNNLAIKLIAKCELHHDGELKAISVLPSFIPKNEALGLTHDEYNGVLIGSSLADEQFFYGKGAGRFPTSSAVLSDISAYRYNYRYEYKKGVVPVDFRQNGSRRIYMSVQSGEVPDLAQYDTIEAQFFSLERSYVVGEMSSTKLESLLSNPEISIISFN